MRRYTGGETVKAGLYWNPKEWEAQIVPREGGALNGTDAITYIRLPLLAVLFLAPIMGGVYAFFLPFIGFAMLLKHMVGRFVRRATPTIPPAVDVTERTVRVKVGEKTKAAEGRRAA